MYYVNNNQKMNVIPYSDNRLIGGGFAAPFILGGITGGLLAPAFYPRPYPRPFYPMPPYPNYRPYPYYY